VTQNKTVIITGGNDSCVKVWGRTNHSLLTQLELFTMPVTRVITDVKDPGVFHACSLNKDIISFDLKKNKAIATHRVANGHVHDLIQKKSAEFEIGMPWLLVSCGSNNPVSFWDVDHTKAVAEIATQEKLLCIDINKSGDFVAAGSENNSVGPTRAGARV
jgi:WD40 repeat protein